MFPRVLSAGEHPVLLHVVLGSGDGGEDNAVHQGQDCHGTRHEGGGHDDDGLPGYQLHLVSRMALLASLSSLLTTSELSLHIFTSHFILCSRV